MVQRVQDPGSMWHMAADVVSRKDSPLILALASSMPAPQVLKEAASVKRNLIEMAKPLAPGELALVAEYHSMVEVNKLISMTFIASKIKEKAEQLATLAFLAPKNTVKLVYRELITAISGLTAVANGLEAGSEERIKVTQL